jgi:small ligand-binding sensory domain FIST
MLWASAISRHPEMDVAVDRVISDVDEGLDGLVPDLVFVFVTDAHKENWARVPALLRARWPDVRVVGCGAAGVVGDAEEAESMPAVTLTGGRLPGVDIVPFHLTERDLPDADPDVDPAVAWRDALGLPPNAAPQLILMADPYTVDAQRLLAGLDAAFPGAPKVGGLTSGGDGPRTGVLFVDDVAHREGVIGVHLGGRIRMDTAVAQGCRPIGEPFFITRCDRNVLFELDGSPAVDGLQKTFEGLDDRSKRLAQRALFLGIVMDPEREAYRSGDFLVRNLMGLDAESGALFIGARLESNRVVQFHLRDAQTSADDLDDVLTHAAAEGHVAGGLLFSCLGRGEGLYGEPDHDSRAFTRHTGQPALGGFFCNGEIGPVQGRTWLHGYTSVFALFREPH